MRLRLVRYEQLIAEELAGIISPEDQAELDKAKAEDPDVYKLWEEKQTLVSEYRVQRWLKERSTPPSVEGLPVIRSNKQVWVAAAGIVIILGIGLSFLLRSKFHQKEHNTPKWVTLSIPPGKDSTIKLADGTTVALNSKSSLSFPSTFSNSSIREVFVDGEAYFNVAKDADHPFIVRSGKGTIHVLGTEFTVNSYDPEQLKVALISGKVLCIDQKDSVVLKPGLKANFTAKGIKTEKFAEKNILSWREGIYEFDQASPEEVIKMIPRFFNYEVTLDNPALAQKRISGILDRKKSIKYNLELLKDVTGIQYTIDKNKVIHLK
jgi:ferric-dicitrate binding protein FerR (iron transport regulator)